MLIFGSDGALVLDSGHVPGVAIVSTPGTQFELTRPDSLYDDLTKMSKYMPQLEQALASGNRADGKSLTDG